MSVRTNCLRKLVAIGSLVCGSAAAGSWTIEIADSTVAGGFSSLRIDSHNNAHVSYVDQVNHLLRYAFWDHVSDRWFADTLDTSGGFCSLVLDSKDHPHISYLDYGGKLTYAHWNGASWEKIPIRINAKMLDYFNSIGLDKDENPRISYYEYWGTGEDYRLALREAAYNGTYWQVRTIDSALGSGKFNAMAMDSKGFPHVAYANVRDENAGMRYARWNGTAWEVTVLEGRAEPHGTFSENIVVDKHDEPHIAYVDVKLKVIKYATKHDGKWTLQPVDRLVEFGYPDRNGIALDKDNKPYISYYDAGQGLLKVAHQKDGYWVYEVVDRNFCGYTSSLQIVGDMMYLTYRDETRQALKFARRQLDETTAPAAADLKVQEKLALRK